MSIEDECRQRMSEHSIRWRSEKVTALIHDSGQLREIHFAGDVKSLPADALFFDGPKTQRSDLAAQLGCDVKEGEKVSTSRKQATCVPGAFVAGDAAAEVQFVAVAISEGALAAVAVNRELQDEDRAATSAKYRQRHAQSVKATAD